MKKYIILFIVIITSQQLFSQAQVSLNYNMRKKLAQSENGNEKMFLLVKGNIGEIKQFVEENHGVFINSAGDIASIKISLNSIPLLINKPFVKQIGSDNHRYLPMNDTMRMLTKVDEVHAGQIPLSKSYKGKGIVMGIIDSGIDFTHPDFKDSLGNTRVKWLWDMTLPNSTNSPAPYGYGQEFSGQQIDNGSASAHTGQDQFGHGTYVSGIAAGNGSAVGHFQGVAPETDLIVVGYDFVTLDFVPRVQHAIEYIFNKAQQMGKPCVINASLGYYDGSHDGLDLEAQYISNLINQQSGRVVVAACGDIGVNYPFHVGRNSLNGDTAFTWFNTTSTIGVAYINVYADTANFRNVRFSIGADKVTPYFHFRGQNSFSSVFPSVNHQLNQTLTVGGNRIGVIHTYTYLNGGVYQIEIVVEPDSTDYLWRFTTTGAGRYDSWTYDIYNPSWQFQNLPSVLTFPDIAHYHAPDTMQTIVSGFNCLNNVISVGNYTNTDRHIDIDSVLQIAPTDFPHRIATNSGRGPTRDGRIKPDILAPGNHIISAGVLSLIPGMQRYKVAPGGYHITGGGTSASAPVVAGIAALFLEQNPNANWLDVKNAMTNCASQDSFMWGPYPNNAWGFGKVNAYEMLTTCSLTTNVNNLNQKSNSIIMYPNPASTNLSIEIPGSRKNKIIVYDMESRKIFQRNYDTENFSLPISSLKNGIYFLEVQPESGFRLMKRFVISH